MVDFLSSVLWIIWDWIGTPAGVGVVIWATAGILAISWIFAEHREYRGKSKKK